MGRDLRLIPIGPLTTPPLISQRVESMLGFHDLFSTLRGTAMWRFQNSLALASYSIIVSLGMLVGCGANNSGGSSTGSGSGTGGRGRTVTETVDITDYRPPAAED